MTTLVNVSCFCRANTFKVPLQTASLPISNDLCHCNSCRHITGQSIGNYLLFDGPPLSVTGGAADLSTLGEYNATGSASRYFCPKCSTHLFWQPHGDEPIWCVTVGSLEKTEGIVTPTGHIWVSDTLDGGIADHIKSVNGVSLPRRKEMSDDVVPLNWRDEKLVSQPDHDRLHLNCRCGSVSFQITRPNPHSTLPHAPYPEAFLPSQLENPNDDKWWLRPFGSQSPTKYLAAHCACDTCRRTSGVEIQSWAYVPAVNISDVSSGSPVSLNLRDKETRPKGLKKFRSSRDRTREFCGTCGATVFWWGDERHELINVSTGLIDEQKHGARAEAWLEWQTERVHYEEDAINKSLIDGLVQGLKA